MSTVIKPKTYSDTFLYNKANLEYEQNLFHFIMKADRIDKSAKEFDDVKYDVKRRQVTNSLLKVLESPNTILLTNPAPLPKAFKSFVAKDVKGGGNDLKLFIDVSEIIKNHNGVWKCNNPDILIAYLLSGMNAFIYYKDPKRIIMHSDIILYGAKIFSKLYTFIIDYLFKISSMSDVKNKCLYLSSMYYLVNILSKDPEQAKVTARRISGLTQREEEILYLQMPDDEESCFLNIKIFTENVSKALRLPNLTLDILVEKWLYLYGTGTQFALELYPAFASMISNVYIGCYINNQKTIEKVISSDLIQFTKAIMIIGDGAV